MPLARFYSSQGKFFCKDKVKVKKTLNFSFKNITISRNSNQKERISIKF